MMAQLIGRRYELEEMERRYSNPGIRTLAIWGRRRVGKTYLIQEFCRNKPHIILTAVEHSYTGSMMAFDKAIDGYTGTERKKDSAHFTDILDRLSGIRSDEGRIVIVIDEYTYLCEEDPDSNSHLQMFIDRELQHMDAFLIICGSAIKMMSSIFTDTNGALYRRFIGPMKLEPLSYRECRGFHPGMSETDMMRLYSVIGGIPLYHLMMDSETFEDCIKNGFLGPFAPLREEAEFIIIRELEPASTNLRILNAISGGHTSGADIAVAAGLTKENCYANLRNMGTIGIVSPLIPMCGADRKNRIYRISDSLIRFSSRVLTPNMTDVVSPDKDRAYDSILPYMETFFGHAFEDICRQFIAEEYRCKDIGSWWGRSEGGSTDIDIVALCDDGGNEYHIVCSCRFSDKMCSMREMEGLERTSKGLKNCFNIKYCMFSRSGFTDELKEYAERSGIRLFTPDDMYGDR